MDVNQQRDLALIERTRAGEAEAREELVKKYIPLVRHIVRRHHGGRMEFEDLVQEGLIGLLGAIDMYRPDRFPVRFSSFAYMCVLRKILNATKQGTGAKQRAHTAAVSLQSGVYGGDGRTILDVQPSSSPDPAEIVANKLIARDLARLLVNHLSALEYTVFGFVLAGLNCGDIGLRIGVDAKVVDNARTRARLKLRRLVDRYGCLLDPRVPRRSPGRSRSAALVRSRVEA